MKERPGATHNMLAHVLLPIPGVRLVGWWIHERTEAMVPTWGSRWRAFRRDERTGRL